MESPTKANEEDISNSGNVENNSKEHITKSENPSKEQISNRSTSSGGGVATVGVPRRLSNKSVVGYSLSNDALENQLSNNSVIEFLPPDEGTPAAEALAGYFYF